MLVFIFSLHEEVAWENSRHFVTQPTASPRNNIWETGAEIPYWWQLSLPRSGYCFWLVETNFPRNTTNQKHFPDLGSDIVISMKFLRSFLRCHFTGKPLVTSRNIGCFLRLLPHEVSEMSCYFVLTTKTTQPCPQVFSIYCPVFCQLIML